MKSSKNKVERYRNLVQHVSNWPSYLLFKMLGNQPNFRFQLRDSFEVSVSRKMLPSFKESFFDNIYLRALPEQFLQKKNPIIVDVGANAGFFSLNMFYHFPKAKILAFEPVPYNFNILKDYQQTYPDFNFHIFQEAVSGEDTTLKLNLSKLDGYTTMASIFESESRGYQIEVPARSLETVLNRQKLAHIDLLKLDCEGAEYQILYHASDDVLSRISNMSIETHEGKEKSESLSALKDFLEKKGFITEALEEGKYSYLWAWRN
ncbi:MAG: FkbM family methyltransferase [Cyclobacteriaceae bacterium]